MSLLIGDVARDLGVSIDALRYYERAGLSTPERDSSGHRRYAESDIDQLQVVLALRVVGVGVQEIRHLISAKDPAADERRRVEAAYVQIEEIDAAIRTRLVQVEAARGLITRWRDELEGWLAANPAH